MPKRQCGTCQWFERFDSENKLGQCRCFPPTSGGFFGRELRFSLVATSTTCLNFNFTAVLSR